MAFGKDNDNRARLNPTFSQQAGHASRQRNSGRGGGGGKRLYWSDNFKPSTNIDMIRFVYGEYKVLQADDATGEIVESTLQWVPIVEHFHGVLQKGALCSGGPLRRFKNKREPCHGCDMFWADYAEREAKKQQGLKGPNRMSMSDKKVLSVLDYGTYYKAEQYDRNGRLRTNQQGVPFYEWQKLQYAGDPAAAGKETKTGRVLPWQMNHPQFETLRGYTDYNIRECCVSCSHIGPIFGRGDSMNKLLQTLGYRCRGCQQAVIDMSTTTLSPQQILELTDNPLQCQGCGHRDYVEEVVHCAVCAANQLTPRRASIWDVDLQVRLQQDPSNPTKNILMIVNHSAPRPIDPNFINLAQPLDLVSMFKPSTLQEQAVLWKLDVPVASGASPQQMQQQHAAPYGGQQPPPQQSFMYGQGQGAPAPQGFQHPAPTSTGPGGFPPASGGQTQ